MAEHFELHERHGFGLATVMARNGVGTDAIAAALGCAAPSRPETATTDELRMIGTGPGTWLVLTDSAQPQWAASLAGRLGGLASISDQSGGYVLFRIGGPLARELLQRGPFIDLDPSIFGLNTAATTVIAHIGVTLWRIDEATFEVALFRSFASSFRHWVAETAAALAYPSS